MNKINKRPKMSLIWFSILFLPWSWCAPQIAFLLILTSCRCGMKMTLMAYSLKRKYHHEGKKKYIICNRCLLGILGLTNNVSMKSVTDVLKLLSVLFYSVFFYDAIFGISWLFIRVSNFLPLFFLTSAS